MQQHQGCSAAETGQYSQAQTTRMRLVSRCISNEPDRDRGDGKSDQPHRTGVALQKVGIEHRKNRSDHAAGCCRQSHRTQRQGRIQRHQSDASGSIGLMALYAALSLGSMGLAAATCSVVTAILPVLYSYLLQGHAGAVRLIGFAVAAVAIWLIAYAPGDKPHPRGLGLAVLAGLGCGTALVLLHVAAVQSVSWALTLMRVASTVVAGAFGLAFWMHGQGSSAKPSFSWRSAFPLAALAGLLDTTGNFFYVLASFVGRLDVAAVLSSLYPAGTMLLAAWLLKERATRSQMAGMVLALAAVALISA